MIIVNLMGGIGNQLFQYAAGRALAIHHKAVLKYTFSDEYKLAKRSMKIDRFTIKADLLAEGEATDYFPKRKVSRLVRKLLGFNYEGKIFRERFYYSFDPTFFNLPDCTYLYGFWQSYAYFENIENQLREELVLLEQSENYQNAVLYIKSLENAVSVHVRRADYLDLKSGFAPLSIDYYRQANHDLISRIGNYKPVIFTDDVQWVKKNLGFMAAPLLASDFKLDDVEELMLMAACRHHIIANSSFSWWGAWLNLNTDKCVIAPRHWHQFQSLDSTLLPPDWTQVL